MPHPPSTSQDVRRAHEEAKAAVYGPDRPIEKNVDELSSQLAILSLLLRKTQARNSYDRSHSHVYGHSYPPRTVSPGNEHVCSYCKSPNMARIRAQITRTVIIAVQGVRSLVTMSQPAGSSSHPASVSRSTQATD